MDGISSLFSNLFSDKAPDEALSAAQAWLKLTDANDAAQSWATASSLFTGAVLQSQWETILPGRRGPLGGVVSRKIASTNLAKSRQGAPDGQYAHIGYKTEFANKKKTEESVELQLDHDGVWRVCGYFFK